MQVAHPLARFGEPVGVSPRTHPLCELSGGERRPARRLAFEPNITGEPPGRRLWKPLRVPQHRERVEELVVLRRGQEPRAELVIM